MARKQLVNTVSLLTILFIALLPAKIEAVRFHSQALEIDEQGQTKEFYDHEFDPEAGTTEYRPLMAVQNQQLVIDDHHLQEELQGSQNRTVGDRSRRKLAPFQLCLVCKCCVNAADLTSCASMPCCFGIDCQLPNKPFGVCAFVPKTCNCTSCPAAH